MDGRSEDSLTVENYAHCRTSEHIRRECRRQLITFAILPDDVLLEIFDFYEDKNMDRDIDPIYSRRIEKWITLAHVCRRWRSVVFQSPRRLNLRLFCTPRTPARDSLDIWPHLPLIIFDHDNIFNAGPSQVDNLIAALEHNDRVSQIILYCCTTSQFEYATNSAMQKPFPELTRLQFDMIDDGPILPDSFLGRTVPRLRELRMECVPFPGLPKLLLSATHLVDLSLSDIPPSGYIPPEAMATTLSALTSLESLRLRFRYPRPRPALESRRPPPPPLTRSTLPSLTKFVFKGASEYLEEILARVDAPRLNKMHITFFNQIIFNTPRLFQFISQSPTLRTPERGYIVFCHFGIRFISQTSDCGVLTVEISCTTSEWQISSLEQVCTSSLPFVSTLEDLYIFENRKRSPRWQDYVENPLWLELLHPFAAVKNLYLCKKFAPHIAPVLQELVGERTTEVFPTLENIFLEGFQPSGPLHEGIEKFVTARRITSRPIAVSGWDSESKRERQSDIHIYDL